MRSLDPRAEPPSFSEVQSFRSNPIALLSCGIGAAVCIAVLAATWGTPEATSTLLVAGTVLVGVVGLLGFGALRVEVRSSGLFVRLVPLTRQHRFEWNEIQSCEARTYRPLREYGGWGVRYGRSGKAYNVHGNRGVQLVFRDGSKLLIGSQRADELAEAIRARR